VSVKAHRRSARRLHLAESRAPPDRAWRAQNAGPCSVMNLVDMDNDARRRLGKPEISGEVGINLLSGVQEFSAGADISKEERKKMMRRFKARARRPPFFTHTRAPRASSPAPDSASRSAAPLTAPRRTTARAC